MALTKDQFTEQMLKKYVMVFQRVVSHGDTITIADLKRLRDNIDIDLDILETKHNEER